MQHRIGWSDAGFLIFLSLAVLFAAVDLSAQARAGSIGAKVSGGGRIVRLVDDGWRFSAADQKGFESPTVDDGSWWQVNVPHTWNDKDAFDDAPGYRRGPSWYRRNLTLGAD